MKSILRTVRLSRHWARTVVRGARQTERRRRLAGRTLALLAMIALVALDPLGMQESSDQRSKNAAWQIFAPFYPGTAASAITVVLIDEETVAGGAMRWPPTYSQYADLLRGIGQNAPKGVFFDLLFMDERGAPFEREEFGAVMEQMADAGMPVFVASPVAAEPAGTGPRASAQDPACDLRRGLIGPVRQGASGTAFVEFSGFGATYPLQAWAACGDGTDAGHARADSPALALYRAGCPAGDSACATLDGVIPAAAPSLPPLMSVRWGDGTAPLNVAMLGASTEELEAQQKSCHATSGSWLEALGRSARYFGAALFASLAPDPPPLRCLYHQTISAGAVLDLMQLRRSAGSLSAADRALVRDRLDALFRDKYVLVGVDLKGLNDYTPSPTHGLVPGVALHAMALDNLLTLGANFHYRDEPFLLELDRNAVFEFTLVAVLLCLELLLIRLLNLDGGETPRRLSRGGKALLLGGLVLFLPLVVLFADLVFLHLTRLEPVNWLGVSMLALTFVAALLVELGGRALDALAQDHSAGPLDTEEEPNR